MPPPRRHCASYLSVFSENRKCKNISDLSSGHLHSAYHSRLWEKETFKLMYYCTPCWSVSQTLWLWYTHSDTRMNVVSLLIWGVLHVFMNTLVKKTAFFLIISLRCSTDMSNRDHVRCWHLLHTLHSHCVVQLRAPCSPSPSFPFPSVCFQINCWECPHSGAQPPPACCCFRCSAPAHSPPLISWVARSFGSD